VTDHEVVEALRIVVRTAAATETAVRSPACPVERGSLGRYCARRSLLCSTFDGLRPSLKIGVQNPSQGHQGLLRGPRRLLAGCFAVLHLMLEPLYPGEERRCHNSWSLKRLFFAATMPETPARAVLENPEPSLQFSLAEVAVHFMTARQKAYYALLEYAAEGE
jgi:hypothetical protein